MLSPPSRFAREKVILHSTAIVVIKCACACTCRSVSVYKAKLNINGPATKQGKSKTDGHITSYISRYTAPPSAVSQKRKPFTCFRDVPDVMYTLSKNT